MHPKLPHVCQRTAYHHLPVIVGTDVIAWPCATHTTKNDARALKGSAPVALLRLIGIFWRGGVLSFCFPRSGSPIVLFLGLARHLGGS